MIESSPRNPCCYILLNTCSVLEAVMCIIRRHVCVHVLCRLFYTKHLAFPFIFLASKMLKNVFKKAGFQSLPVKID